MIKSGSGTVFIWSEGFPFKYSASNEKNFLIAKSLTINGYNVFLVSKLNFINNSNLVGEVEGVKYINFCSSKYKNKYLNYVNATIKEFKHLYKAKKIYKNVYVLYSYTSFIYLIYFSLFCKFCRIKTIINIMEWHIAVSSNLNILKRTNAYLFDKFAIHMADGVITISDFIKKKLTEINIKKSIIKIPILTDINKIDQVLSKNNLTKPYLLFCANSGYLEGVRLVIKSFIEYVNESQKDLELVLIINGDLSSLKKQNNSNIKIISNIDFNALISYYKNAEVVFAPLRNTTQDIARYPQKIAEYCACSKAIISNKIGQVGIDFTHLDNIYFADEFNVCSYKKALNELLSNKNLKESIETNARKKSELYFDYKLYSNKLETFLSSLSK